jgi:hypothetical protein
MKTEIIPTKIHGYIDYFAAASLMTLPLLFSGKKKGAETYFPIIMGAGALIQSLLTDYELGAKKVLNMKQHLTLDYMNGALMTVSPLLFGFYKRSWLPHLSVGLSEMAVAFLSKDDPQK